VCALSVFFERGKSMEDENVVVAQDESQFITLMQTALTATPGFLKVITDEVKPELRQDAAVARSPIRQDVVDADANVLRKADTFVLHNVVAIDPHPTREGVFRASTAEGDFCDGRPKALWDRLTVYQTL
jgi:hypothetical protein